MPEMDAPPLPVRLLALWRFLTRRCPHCRRGPIFSGLYASHESCPGCGLRYQQDEGDFFGGMVFAYTFGGIAGLAMAAVLIMWGVERWEIVAYAAAGACVVAILLLFPYAKSLWIHLLYQTRGHYEEYRPPVHDADAP